MTNTFPVLAAGITAWIALEIVTPFIPVTALMRGEAIERTETRVTLRVTGRKVRDCQVVGGTFVGWSQGPDGVWHEGSISFPNDATPDSSRPTGRQSFGLFRWDGVVPGAERVKATVTHNCDGHLRITTVGPFTIE